MDKWRKALAFDVEVGDPEAAVRRLHQWQHGRVHEVGEPEVPPAYQPGQQVHVTPDEDDEFDEPFVSQVGEASWNLVFNQYIYPVTAPDGTEYHVLENQVKPS